MEHSGTAAEVYLGRRTEARAKDARCARLTRPGELRYRGSLVGRGFASAGLCHVRPDFGELHAHGKPTCQEGTRRAQVQDEDARAPRCAAEARGLHARLHDDPEEAELGAAEGGARSPDEQHGGHHLHPRRGPQPAGALGRADPRRPGQGPAGDPLQGHPRSAGHGGGLRPPPGPLQVRGQEELAMPRRAEVQVRVPEADPVYDSRLVAQLVNSVMRDGKKSTAEHVVYKALERVGERTGKPPVEVLEQAVKSVTPVLEVRSRRVGGANYQVPVEVPQRRARTLAIRWLVNFARERREKHMDEKLAAEILDALNQQGGAFKRKDDRYRMSQANKAFAHYRW